MFEEARLLGPTERSIVVETRKGARLPNLIEVEPGEHERRRYGLLLDKYGRNWTPRKPATGGYNCAGHVWASRRTALLEPESWKTVLEDDGYRRLDEGEEPMVGDLVLYVERKTREFLHVGCVMELQPGVAPGSPPVPRVLSKWNSTSGEVLHNVMDVPYGQQGFSVIAEYWTDRLSMSGGISRV
jgi:hypothetical protein